jgi:hypothetical protein
MSAREGAMQASIAPIAITAREVKRVAEESIKSNAFFKTKPTSYKVEVKPLENGIYKIGSPLTVTAIEEIPIIFPYTFQNKKTVTVRRSITMIKAMNTK